jgi:glycine cleavage system H protein
MAYPTQYRYTKEHQWIDAKGDTGTIGITDYAQSELADVVSVDLPPVGAELAVGKQFASVESVKAESEIDAPVNGKVEEVNTALQTKPELINHDAHGAGWLVKIKLANPSEVNTLMDAAAYEAFIAEKKKEASA